MAPLENPPNSETEQVTPLVSLEQKPEVGVETTPDKVDPRYKYLVIKAIESAREKIKTSEIKDLKDKVADSQSNIREVYWETLTRQFVYLTEIAATQIVLNEQKKLLTVDLDIEAQKKILADHAQKEPKDETWQLDKTNLEEPLRKLEGQKKVLMGDATSGMTKKFDDSIKNLILCFKLTAGREQGNSGTINQAELAYLKENVFFMATFAGGIDEELVKVMKNVAENPGRGRTLDANDKKILADHLMKYNGTFQKPDKNLGFEKATKLFNQAMADSAAVRFILENISPSEKFAFAKYLLDKIKDSQKGLNQEQQVFLDANLATIGQLTEERNKILTNQTIQAEKAKGDYSPEVLSLDTKITRLETDLSRQEGSGEETERGEFLAKKFRNLLIQDYHNRVIVPEIQARDKFYAKQFKPKQVEKEAGDQKYQQLQTQLEKKEQELAGLKGKENLTALAQKIETENPSALSAEYGEEVQKIWKIYHDAKNKDPNFNEESTREARENFKSSLKKALETRQQTLKQDIKNLEEGLATEKKEKEKTDKAFLEVSKKLEEFDVKITDLKLNKPAQALIENDVMQKVESIRHLIRQQEDYQEKWAELEKTITSPKIRETIDLYLASYKKINDRQKLIEQIPLSYASLEHPTTRLELSQIRNLYGELRDNKDNAEKVKTIRGEIAKLSSKIEAKTDSDYFISVKNYCQTVLEPIAQFGGPITPAELEKYEDKKTQLSVMKTDQADKLEEGFHDGYVKEIKKQISNFETEQKKLPKESARYQELKREIAVKEAELDFYKQRGSKYIKRSFPDAREWEDQDGRLDIGIPELSLLANREKAEAVARFSAPGLSPEDQAKLQELDQKIAALNKKIEPVLKEYDKAVTEKARQDEQNYLQALDSLLLSGLLNQKQAQELAKRAEEQKMRLELLTIDRDPQTGEVKATRAGNISKQIADGTYGKKQQEMANQVKEASGILGRGLYENSFLKYSQFDNALAGLGVLWGGVGQLLNLIVNWRDGGFLNTASIAYTAIGAASLEHLTGGLGKGTFTGKHLSKTERANLEKNDQEQYFEQIYNQYPNLGDYFMRNFEAITTKVKTRESTEHLPTNQDIKLDLTKDLPDAGLAEVRQIYPAASAEEKQKALSEMYNFLVKDMGFKEKKEAVAFIKRLDQKNGLATS